MQLSFNNNEQGVSIIGSVFTLIILGVMGAALVAIMATEQESRMKSITHEESFYSVQAGFEYALREINEGGYPVVTEKQFGRSSFTTTIDPGPRRITVVGASEETSKAHSITTDLLAKDCLLIDDFAVAVGGTNNNELVGIVLKKSCLNAVTIDTITLSWTPLYSEKVKKITMGGVVVYDDFEGAPSGTAIDNNDFTIDTSAIIDAIEFSADITGKSFDMTIGFTDTSAVTDDEIEP